MANQVVAGAGGVFGSTGGILEECDCPCPTKKWLCYEKDTGTCCTGTECNRIEECDCLELGGVWFDPANEDGGCLGYMGDGSASHGCFCTGPNGTLVEHRYSSCDDYPSCCTGECVDPGGGGTGSWVVTNGVSGGACCHADNTCTDMCHPSFCDGEGDVWVADTVCGEMTGCCYDGNSDTFQQRHRHFCDQESQTFFGEGVICNHCEGVCGDNARLSRSVTITWELQEPPADHSWYWVRPASIRGGTMTLPRNAITHVGSSQAIGCTDYTAMFESFIYGNQIDGCLIQGAGGDLWGQFVNGQAPEGVSGVAGVHLSVRDSQIDGWVRDRGDWSGYAAFMNYLFGPGGPQEYPGYEGTTAQEVNDVMADYGVAFNLFIEGFDTPGTVGCLDSGFSYSGLAPGGVGTCGQDAYNALLGFTATKNPNILGSDFRVNAIPSAPISYTITPGPKLDEALDEEPYVYTCGNQQAAPTTNIPGAVMATNVVRALRGFFHHDTTTSSDDTGDTSTGDTSTGDTSTGDTSTDSGTPSSDNNTSDSGGSSDSNSGGGSYY